MIITYSLWFGVGAGLAFLSLKSIEWSVGLINPEKPTSSQFYVISGAVIRWIVIFALLLIALNDSVFAMLALFISYLIFRLLILIVWNQTVFLKDNLGNQNKKDC